VRVVVVAVAAAGIPAAKARGRPSDVKSGPEGASGTRLKTCWTSKRKWMTATAVRLSRVVPTVVTKSTATVTVTTTTKTTMTTTVTKMTKRWTRASTT